MPFGDVNRINTNLGALSALNALTDVNRQLQVSQLRLATGKRINTASDDPSGYSISNTLARKARGLGVALAGVQTVENLLGVAEGGLGNIKDILLTMRELVVQGASDTLGTTERTAINTQLDSLQARSTGSPPRPPSTARRSWMGPSAGAGAGAGLQVTGPPSGSKPATPGATSSVSASPATSTRPASDWPS